MTRVRAEPASDAVARPRTVLQRACACGEAAGLEGACPACAVEARLGVQPKLALGVPGDRYEREADRIAERVVAGGPVPAAVTPLGPTGPAARSAAVERATDAAMPRAEAATLQRRGEEDDEEEMLQAKAEAAPTAPAAAGPVERAAAAVASGGRPLSPAERGFFEPRLGRDLSAVRLHADAAAGAAARAIGARAYTLGNHVAFAPGAYDSRSRAGRRLVAHELVHTLQQDRAPRERAGGDMIQRSGEPIEVEIEEVTPERQAELERQGIDLPEATADAMAHRDYVENRLQAVGYGLMLGGFLLYVDDLEQPLFVSHAMIDGATSDFGPISNAIYPNYDAAMGAVPVGPPAPGAPYPEHAYYRTHGGVVAPTVFTRRNAPKTLELMDGAVKKLAETVQQEMSVLAFGIAGGILIRGAISVISKVRGLGKAVAERFSRRTPPTSTKVKPVNGKINVGGGFETGADKASNLQPFIPGTGGPAAGTGVPNHVAGKFEEIADFFEPGSANLIYSNRLTGSTVNWKEAARGAYKVMAKDGNLSLNVWVKDAAKYDEIIKAFTDAGFRNVGALGPKTGPGVVILGTK